MVLLSLLGLDYAYEMWKVPGGECSSGFTILPSTHSTRTNGWELNPVEDGSVTSHIYWLAKDEKSNLIFHKYNYILTVYWLMLC